MNKINHFRILTRSLIHSKLNYVRWFHPSGSLLSFYERDRRGGVEYPAYVDMPWQQLLRESNKALLRESKLFWEEMKEKFRNDPKMYKQGDTDVFFRFDSEECLKQWTVSSDKLLKEGNSECTLTINDKKKAVFSGIVDLTPPKDGKNRFAGYCAIRSVRKRRSFFREDAYDFEPFTHLELRVKGDGRNYAINLGLQMYFDVSWFTTYTYSIFTHGGPYWQVVRIPFSKFFVTSKGRIQDKQCPIKKDRINSIGITCAGVAGPFRLEIDYIGCHVDIREKEKFAYEMYDIPKQLVSS